MTPTPHVKTSARCSRAQWQDETIRAELERDALARLGQAVEINAVAPVGQPLLTWTHYRVLDEALPEDLTPADVSENLWSVAKLEARVDVEAPQAIQ